MSHKRKKLYDENQQSSGVLDIQGDLATLVSFNAPLGEVNVNLGGDAVIVNRDVTFGAKPEYVSWVPTLAIPSPSPNGSFIVYVDNAELVKIANINNLSKLPAFDSGGLDMNNAVQIGTYSITNGTITSGAPIIQWTGNLDNRLKGLSDALSVVNYFGERIRNDIVAGTLNLQIITGKAFTRTAGVVNSLITKRPDIVEVPNISPSVIGLALRNNVIVSFGTAVDVLNYESPVGTLSVIPPNKAVNRFFVVFPNNQFTGYQLGQTTYTTPLLAQDSFEESEFSSIFANGVPTIQLSLDKSETDLSNALVKNLPRLL